MLVSPIKGRKAKTVSCKDAVTNTVKKADISDITFKKCVNAKICTPVDAEIVKIKNDNITQSCKTASVSKNRYSQCKPKDLYINKSSRHISDDLKIEELFRNV
ncbi:MAG: hypothetical protein MR384_04370 [Lachnospiraceae bacterium]|nr:hypothetical protein [Lachnospiraceae bacterium]MCI5587106.1 hypothetical protein [Lachnospiraceae bacterium]